MTATPTIDVRRAGDRPHTKIGWLDSKHSFSFGHHYDTTLMAWHRNFQKAWPSLKDRYDERFKRMWDYYLLSCAGAFRSRSIQLWQILLSKHDAAPNPPPVQPDYG